jgi:hypothetical protein
LGAARDPLEDSIIGVVFEYAQSAPTFDQFSQVSDKHSGARQILAVAPKFSRQYI